MIIQDFQWNYSVKFGQPQLAFEQATWLCLNLSTRYVVPWVICETNKTIKIPLIQSEIKTLFSNVSKAQIIWIILVSSWREAFQ